MDYLKEAKRNWTKEFGVNTPAEIVPFVAYKKQIERNELFLESLSDIDTFQIGRVIDTYRRDMVK